MGRTVFDHKCRDGPAWAQNRYVFDHKCRNGPAWAQNGSVFDHKCRNAPDADGSRTAHRQPVNNPRCMGRSRCTWRACHVQREQGRYSSGRTRHATLSERLRGTGSVRHVPAGTRSSDYTARITQPEGRHRSPPRRGGGGSRSWLRTQLGSNSHLASGNFPLVSWQCA